MVATFVEMLTSNTHPGILCSVTSPNASFLACAVSDVMSMSDILATLLFLLVPLRHSKADRRMAKDTFALIQEMVVA